MSWGLNDNCYRCPNAKICPDVDRIRQAVTEIHQDPKHGEIGGWGNIQIVCGKKDNLISKEMEELKAEVEKLKEPKLTDMVFRD
jgi:hypothetical protein